MEATLQRIYDEENAPSAYQLYKLARKAGHAYTKEKVDEFVKKQAAAQILTARKAPNRVTGKFQSTRANEKWQLDLLDRSTKPSQLDGVAQTHVLAVVDVFTRRGYLEPLVDKKKDTVLEAYQRITERAGANPQILSLDKEGATLSNDGAFEAFLDEKGTVVRRAEGRNDLAIIDGYMGQVGLGAGRIRLKKKLRMNQWAPEIAGVEAALNRKPMTTLRGNAPRDIEQAIASTDPEEKVVEFQQLEQQARNIAINRKEDKKVTRALEREGAFRAPIEARGVIRTRNRPGKARFEGKVTTTREWEGRVWQGCGCQHWPELPCQTRRPRCLQPARPSQRRPYRTAGPSGASSKTARYSRPSCSPLWTSWGKTPRARATSRSSWWRCPG